MELIAVTLCMELSLDAKGRRGAWFHFIGAWNGHWVQQICLDIPQGMSSLQVGEEYVILLQVAEVVDSILFGRIKRIAPLASFERFP